MRRRLHISSRLTAAAVFEALNARNRDWREGDIPDSLKRFGALGFRFSQKGKTFELRVDRPQRDSVFIYCVGTIQEVPEGSYIEATLRRTSFAWWGIPVVWGLVGWQLWRGPLTASLAVFAGLGTVLFAVLEGILYLKGQSQVEVEHRAFEAVLRRAAVGNTDPLTVPTVAG